jgi:hypothetical protein
MKDILFVEDPIFTAAHRDIQSKFRNVFTSSHIALLSALTLTGGESTVWSRTHSGVGRPAVGHKIRGAN